MPRVREYIFLSTMRSKIVGFEYLKDLYADEDFKDAWTDSLTKKFTAPMMIQVGYLFC